jgi:uncharacterized membrane protein
MSQVGSPADDKSGFDAGNLLALATLLVALAGAWLYVAGQMYAYHYYGSYGLGLVGLGLAQQDYLVFGAWVLRAHPFWAIVWALLTFIVARVVRYWASPGWMLAWLVIASAMAFQLAYVAAPGVARRHFADDKAGDYRAQPLVAVSVDPAWLTDPSLRDRATALESGCYRLLVGGDQHIVLLRPFRDAPEAELSTTVLRWEAVRMLRVLPYGRSCR